MLVKALVALRALRVVQLPERRVELVQHLRRTRRAVHCGQLEVRARPAQHLSKGGGGRVCWVCSLVARVRVCARACAPP